MRFESDLGHSVFPRQGAFGPLTVDKSALLWALWGPFVVLCLAFFGRGSVLRSCFFMVRWGPDYMTAACLGGIGLLACCAFA